MPTAHAPHYLTLAEVAEELRVSIRTVTRYVERGHLRAVQLPGGRLRVARADLDTALAGWSR
jgi:excisionase family DNA binding protein